MQTAVERVNVRVGAWLGACLLACAVGCADGNSPYDMVKVSGTLKYEDGSLIPADAIMLRFDPQAAPLDAKTHPRKGMTQVNVADGTFDSVTTHKYGDGIVAGRHTVYIFPTVKGKAAKLIPDEYNDSAKTPLVVDTDDQPFELRVKKPKS